MYSIFLICEVVPHPSALFIAFMTRSMDCNPHISVIPTEMSSGPPPPAPLLKISAFFFNMESNVVVGGAESWQTAGGEGPLTKDHTHLCFSEMKTT